MRFESLPKFLALIALLAPSKALAWGAEGHEIVAAIALRELTPVARQEVGRLLGGPVMMVHDASWADEIRDSRPETGAWHYVDIPLWAGSYDAQRDCGNGDCVVAQIGDDLRVLFNRRAPDAVRAEALRFLIHFVADVHQPLHAEDNDDKGGNQVHLRLGRERASLHKLWDVDVVEPLGPDPDAIAESIERNLSPDQRQDWQSALRRAGPTKPMRSHASTSIPRLAARTSCGCRAIMRSGKRRWRRFFWPRLGYGWPGCSIRL